MLADEHELPGFEPDNLLAFLALLGLLRALETAHPEWQPRASWRGTPPRAVLHLESPTTRDDVVRAAISGIGHLEQVQRSVFKDEAWTRCSDRRCRKIDLRTTPEKFRGLADQTVGNFEGARLLSALASDAIRRKTRDKKDEVEPTPLCLVSGQGHQHFLDRLATVMSANDQETESTIHQTLFYVWEYNGDLSWGFRWDPREDRRHAYRFGDPGDDTSNATERGANILAAIGFVAMTTVPTASGLATVGVSRRKPEICICWPLVGVPTSFVGHVALLAHPWLADPEKASELRVYGVRAVARARRIQVERRFNVERAAVQFFA